MKKIIIIIIFIASPLLANAITGDGTYANPWSGPLEGDATWSGTKYINGDITVDNEKLTISPGAIIIFLSESADLIITATGQLEADGTAGSMIRFTSDDDNDGTYGETGERWGHITFQSMGSAGTSLVDNCIIEYGDVRTAGGTDNPFRYGGAIHAAFSNLIISNCILRNNKAKWGGALFVNKTFSPAIKNCYILNNESDRAGGGAYFWDGSASLVENCLFEENACLETTNNNYSGGGLCAQTGTSIKVLNCTFVNNTTARPNGAGIELYGSSSARVINTIFWGSSNQVFLSGTGGNAIINCAIQASVPTGSVNCIILNSSNTDPSGPNFIAIDGTDWSINFISPCRDKGVNSYTGVTIPFADYEGNPRIRTKDIGTYEIQYSLWKTTPDDVTSWNDQDNWEEGLFPGVSGGTGDVVIPPLTGSSVAPNISGTTTISTGKYMVLEPGGKATFAGLSNSGTLRLESNADSIASLIVTTYTDSGNEQIEMFLTGGGTISTYKWHYFSIPVSTLPVNTFTGVTLDIVGYNEPRVSTDLLQGWVAWDGYVYAAPSGYDYNYDFVDLSPGIGYDYWNESNYEFTFNGSLNVVNQAMLLNYSGTANSGFNLLGNPFSAGLNWNTIINDVNYPSSTSKGLYFTRNNLQCSYIGGVGIPAGVSGIIPPMQGFFVKTSATGKTINLTPSARTHDKIHTRYKGTDVIALVRLSILEDTVTDETVVRFDESAKSYLDNDFDALKVFDSPENLGIYSYSGGIRYAINGLPFPDTFVEIPIIVNLVKEGDHSITSTQLQGLDNYHVYLIDNSTGFTANLKTTPVVTFSAPAGLISDRFILKIIDISTGNEELVTSDNNFNIYQGYGQINIRTLADEWDGKTGSVRILDMAGKTVSDNQKTEFSKNSVTQVQSPEANGLYFIEIRSGVKRFIGKIIIK